CSGALRNSLICLTDSVTDQHLLKGIGAPTPEYALRRYGRSDPGAMGLSGATCGFAQEPDRAGQCDRAAACQHLLVRPAGLAAPPGPARLEGRLPTPGGAGRPCAFPTLCCRRLPPSHMYGIIGPTRRLTRLRRAEKTAPQGTLCNARWNSNSS